MNHPTTSIQALLIAASLLQGCTLGFSPSDRFNNASDSGDTSGDTGAGGDADVASDTSNPDADATTDAATDTTTDATESDGSGADTGNDTGSSDVADDADADDPEVDSGGVDSFEFTWFRDEARASVFADPLLADPGNLLAPNFVPAPDSPVAGAGIDPTGAGFEGSDYIGACAAGGDDWTLLWTSSIANVQSTVPDGFEPTLVEGVLDTDVTWTTGSVMQLSGAVIVSGATLTIEAGVLVVAESGAVLVIEPGASILALGTAESPVVFTSAAAPAERAPGDWGGILLAGTGEVLGGDGVYPGPLLGAGVAYGGADAFSSCGLLDHVRIEYAGGAGDDDGAMACLTLAGCGGESAMLFVQTAFCADDGIEVIGGSPNLRRIVVTQPGDDGLDWESGWLGNLEFLAVQLAAGRGDAALEGRASATTPTQTPVSNPALSNLTLVGGGSGSTHTAIRLLDGTRLTALNTLVTRFAGQAIDLSPDVEALLTNADANMTHFLFFEAPL